MLSKLNSPQPFLDFLLIAFSTFQAFPGWTNAGDGGRLVIKWSCMMWAQCAGISRAVYRALYRAEYGENLDTIVLSFSDSILLLLCVCQRLLQIGLVSISWYKIAAKKQKTAFSSKNRHRAVSLNSENFLLLTAPSPRSTIVVWIQLNWTNVSLESTLQFAKRARCDLLLVDLEGSSCSINFQPQQCSFLCLRKFQQISTQLWFYRWSVRQTPPPLAPPGSLR